MALQNQTYANSGSGYYIAGQTPVVPGDTALQGPLEILPALAPGAPSAVFYNRIDQSDAAGITISEYQTPATLKGFVNVSSDGRVAIASNPNTTSLAASLSLGNNGSAGAGRISANNGLLIADASLSGTALQIRHDTATNNNIISNVDNISGAEIRLNTNNEEIRFANPVTTDLIRISPTTDQIEIASSTSPTAFSMILTRFGLQMANALTAGALAIGNGASVLLESFTNVKIRTNTIGVPIDAITANADGSVDFANTIRATTSNTTTIGNTGLTTTGTLTVNTSAAIPLLTTPIRAAVSTSTPYGMIENANPGDNPAYPVSNYKGQLLYNTLRADYGAPATATQSLELVSLAGGPASGGIQFYNTDGTNAGTPVWMGGFQKYGTTKEFRLPATVNAVLPTITGVNTINGYTFEPFPSGIISQYAGSVAPQGWLICLGQALDGTNPVYTSLWNAIGTIYGGSGQNNFLIPDFRNRTAFGATDLSPAVNNSRNYVFTITCSTFDNVTGSSTPNGLPARQVLSVVSTEQELAVGMTLPDYGGVIITGISGGGGYAGDNGSYPTPGSIILTLSAALPVGLTSQTINVQANGKGFGLGTATINNLIEQQPLQVANHNHAFGFGAGGINALNESNNPIQGQDTSGPKPNAFYQVNGTGFTIPQKMNNRPSAIVVNYIIHL